MQLDEKRKMAFFEVGSYTSDGKAISPLLEELQSAFESIQKKAEKFNANCSFVLKMTAVPRKSKQDKYGCLKYEIKESAPVQKSISYTTELNNDGLIISTGKSEIDIDQLDLDLNVPTIHQINKA